MTAAPQTPRTLTEAIRHYSNRKHALTLLRRSAGRMFGSSARSAALQTANTIGLAGHAEALEQVFRFNTRLGHTDGTRFQKVLAQVAGKRLTWNDLTGKDDSLPEEAF